MTRHHRQWLATVAVMAVMAVLAIPAGPAVASVTSSGVLRVSAAAACQRGAIQQPIDPPTGSPWYKVRLGLDHVAGLSLGEGQLVAVVDTGVAPVPALGGALLSGIDLTSQPATDAARTSTGAVAGPATVAVDCDGRGTLMAGLIAARRGAAPQVRGLARAAEILPVRVALGVRELPEPVLVGRAITDAVAAGAGVVVIGSAVRDDPALRAATTAALATGVSVVAAAGDGDDVELAYPASYEGVIAVAATDAEDGVRPVNALGHVTVGAPGVDMVGLGLNGEYVGGQQGSALAAAIVAATVAALRAEFPESSPEWVRERVLNTADRPGFAVPDPSLGWGVVNPVTALTAPIEMAPPVSGALSGPAVSGAVASDPAVSAPSTSSGAVVINLPPEPADARWAVVAAAVLLAVAGSVAAVVAGARRAKSRKWRPAADSVGELPEEDAGIAAETTESLAVNAGLEAGSTESARRTPIAQPTDR